MAANALLGLAGLRKNDGAIRLLSAATLPLAFTAWRTRRHATAAAVALARFGRAVLVIEAHDTVGGGEFTDRGTIEFGDQRAAWVSLDRRDRSHRGPDTKRD